MAGQRNKNAFKFLSIIDTITKTYSGCEESVLGWFRGGLGVSTDPDRSYHFTKNPFEVYLPFIG